MQEIDTIKHNAEYAEREFGINQKLFTDVCEQFARSIKHGEIIGYNSNLASKVDTSFAVGFIVGMLMANNDIKVEDILK